MTEEELPLTGDLLATSRKIRGRVDAAKRNVESNEILVVVWGPGPDHPHYKKRLQIRAALRKMPGVKAYFPEEEALKKLITDASPLGATDDVAVELLQCQVADLVIALETASGVKDEVALVSRKRALAGKVVSFLPKELEATEKTSFSGALRSRIDRQYFSPEEFDACTVATERCPAVAYNEQIERWCP